jgi:glycosyltransferase involved in cell wall biosynthesis
MNVDERVLLVGAVDAREWRTLSRDASVVESGLPRIDTAITSGGLANQAIEALFAAATRAANRHTYAIAECTDGLLWLCLFRLVGDRTPFAIAPRFNHVRAREAFALLLASQLTDPRVVLFCGSRSASTAFEAFGFGCSGTYLPGIDCESFQPVPGGRPAARRSLGIDDDRERLLYAGRLAEDKHVLELLEAFAMVRKARDVELVLCVNFPTCDYAKRCRERAAEIGDVRILEAVPRDQLVLWYNAADLFVMTAVSLFETFGRAPVEAMACGTPAVVSGYDGLRETVTPSVGWLVAPVTRCGRKSPDVQAFGETVLAGLSDRQKLAEKALAAPARAREFDMACAAQSLRQEMRTVRQETITPPRSGRVELGRYPSHVAELWEQLEGRDIIALLCDFLRSGRLPVQPRPDAVRRYFEAWFEHY